METQQRVREIIEQSELPSFVVDEVIKLDTDSSGDEAFWVWIIVGDNAVKANSFFPAARELTRRIRDRVEDAGEERWVHVRYRTRSEQDAIESAQHR